MRTGLLKTIAIATAAVLVAITVDAIGGGTVITGAANVPNNYITNARLRDSVGLSVIGRSANSSGDPADIIAAVDGDVLRRSGTSIGFGSIPEGSVDGVITAVVAGNGLTGGATSGTATLDITASSDFSVGADLLDLSTTITAPGTLDTVGDFSVATSKFTVAASTGNTLAAGTLSATGDFKVNTNKFVVTASSGNTTIAGTLDVTGAITEGSSPVLSGTIASNTIPKGSSGNLADSSVTDDGTTFAVATNKFTVTEASGNTLVAGTLDATGDFKVNTNKFTVTASSGNTLVAGTLDATGNFTVNANKFAVTASSGDFYSGAAAFTKTWVATGSELTRDAATYNIVTSYGNSTVAPRLFLFHGEGTGASTTATASGDTLGLVEFAGAPAATTFFSGALISAVTTEAWGSGRGTQMLFLTTPNTTGTRAQVMMLDEDGQAAFGPAAFTPDASVNMHVRRADAAGVPAANTSTVLEVENSAAAYITIAAADSSDHGILFARTNSNVDGSILYDNSSTTRGFDFRTGGNTSRMTIDSSGNVLAKFNLTANGNTVLGDTTSDTASSSGNFDVATNKFTVAATTGNTLVAGTFTENGNASLGDATSDTVTVAGVMGVNGAVAAAAQAILVTTPASSTAVRLNNASTGQTSTNGSTMLIIPNGSFDTTAAAITHTGNRTVMSLTRSAGANTFLQIGQSAEISAGQNQNVGFQATITGATATANIAFNANASGSSGTNYSFFGAAGIMHQVGDFDINTNKFTIQGTTGNTLVAGTLDVTSDLKVNTNKFTVTASSGDTVAAGTFNGQGAGDFDSTLNVDGNTTFNGNNVIGNANADLATVFGHVLYDGTAPSKNAGCDGAGAATVTGSDASFRIATGAGSTACTITFSRTWTVAPVCTVFPEGGVAVPTCTISATAITCTVNLGGATYDWHCSTTNGGA